MTDIVIHKGDRLTYAGSNELYATALRDIERYEPMHSDAWEFADGKSHKGEQAPTDVIRAEDGNARYIHLNGAWLDLRTGTVQMDWDEHS